MEEKVTLLDIGFQTIKKWLISIKKKAIKQIAKYFDNFGKYKVTDLELEVSYSNGTIKEIHTKSDDLTPVAKILPQIEFALENAVLISSEDSRYFNDNNTLFYHNLLSGYIEDGYFVTIRFSVKETVDNQNTLYVIVSQNRIKLEVIDPSSSQFNENDGGTRSSFNLRISNIINNVNTPDLLRYIPNDLLNTKQIKIKKAAIADTIKYSNNKNKNDKEYFKFYDNDNIPAMKNIVKRAAAYHGYKIKAFHGSYKFFTKFDDSGKNAKHSKAPLGAYFFSENEDVAYTYTGYKHHTNLNINSYTQYDSVKNAYIEGFVKVDSIPIKIKLSIRKSNRKNIFWVHNIQLENGTGNKPGGINNSLPVSKISDADKIVPHNKNTVNSKPNKKLSLDELAETLPGTKFQLFCTL